MGIAAKIRGLGKLLREAGALAGVLRGSRADEAEAEHEENLAALAQLSREFDQMQSSWFDRLINGLNRLPRPALALGTLGLFAYAMVDPLGFSSRMTGLILVPDQLWWLLGAIVSFYFGARELHYLRSDQTRLRLEDVVAVTDTQARIDAMRDTDAHDPDIEEETPMPSSKSFLGGIRWPWSRRPAPRPPQQPAKRITDPHYNAALEDWRATVGQ